MVHSKQVRLYLSIECFKISSGFLCCIHIKITFILWFYILFIFNNCCIKSEIQIFLIPKLYLQLKYTIFIYWCNRCIDTNYIVHIRFMGHQMDELNGALLSFLVYGSGVEVILVSLIT